MVEVFLFVTLRLPVRVEPLNNLTMSRPSCLVYVPLVLACLRPLLVKRRSTCPQLLAINNGRICLVAGSLTSSIVNLPPAHR